MAQVQQPIVPGRLYRYRSLTRSPEAVEQEIDAIVERHLYCAQFTKMNDPMEGFYEPSAVLQEEQDYRYIVNDVLNSKAGLGIACFTETYEDVLMWTHYAGNYSGMCVSYDTPSLLDGLPNTASLARVAYADAPPLLFPEQVNNSYNAAVRVLSTKKYNWAYEREWRVLAPIGRVQTGRFQCVRRIYFGSRVSNDHRSRILRKIQGTDIKAYMMSVVGYEHSWEPVNQAAREREARDEMA